MNEMSDWWRESNAAFDWFMRVGGLWAGGSSAAEDKLTPFSSAENSAPFLLCLPASWKERRSKVSWLIKENGGREKIN